MRATATNLLAQFPPDALNRIAEGTITEEELDDLIRAHRPEAREFHLRMFDAYHVGTPPLGGSVQLLVTVHRFNLENARFGDW